MPRSNFHKSAKHRLVRLGVDQAFVFYRHEEQARDLLRALLLGKRSLPRYLRSKFDIYAVGLVNHALKEIGRADQYPADQVESAMSLTTLTATLNKANSLFSNRADQINPMSVIIATLAEGSGIALVD